MKFRMNEADQVDPRVCGVADGYPTEESLEQGRSPRMRGSLPVPPTGAAHLRSIPAYAG